MDQLKKQLAIVLEYGFWIGSVTVLLGSLGVWYLSSSDLSNKLQSQIGKIKSDANKLTSLRSSMSDQPNETSHIEMKRLIADRENEVLDAWTSVYEAQRRLLTWPKTPELPDKFINEFRHPKDPETGQFLLNVQKLPYEKYVQYPIPENQKVPQFILRNYQRYIGKVLPDIAKIGKAEWTADFESTGSGGGMGGMMEEGFGNEMMTGRGKQEVTITGQKEGPLVAWSKANQEAVLKDLFPWRGRRPDNLEVYYSQENLWILKQLLEIIAKVNGDARQPFEAKIREIRKLAIGKSVRSGAGSIANPGANIAGGMDGMEGMEEMIMMGSEEGMEMGGGGIELTAVDPADNRYVDTALQPITGSQLRSAFSSKNPSDANLAVAKRVQIMLSLQMDQRYIPQLMTECGNAPLMVEVKQIRVLPKSKSAAGSMGGGMMDDEGDDNEMNMGGGMGGLGMQSGGAAPQVKKEEFPLDLSIELYGLIYIYNPPDRESLGLDKVDANTVIDGTAIGKVADQTGTTDLPPPNATAPVTPPATPPVTPPAETDPTAPEAAPPAPGTTTPAPPANNQATTQPAAGPVAIGTPAPLVSQ